MDQTCNKEEVYLFCKSALPGYLYNKKSREYFPRRDGKAFNLYDCSYRYRVEHSSMSDLKNEIKNLRNDRYGPTWINDLGAEAPADAILIKGIKILEKRAYELTKDDFYHTVMSTLYKGRINMLLTFSQEVEVSMVNELLKYIKAVLNGSSGDSFPKMIMSFSKSTFIYDKFFTETNDRTKTSTSKHAIDEFCRMLKISKLSTVPLTCFLAEPSSSKANEICDRNLPLLISGKTPKVPVDEYVNVATVHGSACSGRAENGHLVGELDKVKKELDQETSPLDNAEQMRKLKVDVDKKYLDNNKSSFDGQRNYMKDDVMVETKVDEECKSNLKENLNEKLKAKEKHSKGCRSASSSNECIISDASIDEQSNATKIHIDEENKVDTECIIDLNGNPDEKLKAKEKHSQECMIAPNSKERNSSHPISHYSENQIIPSTSKVQEEKLNEVENVSCPVKTPEKNTASLKCKAENEQIDLNFLNPIKIITNPCGIEHKYYGQMNPTLPEKVVLLLGASGCGKTTLLNFIANYYEGKKTADEGLVQVVTMVAPTSLITAYTFCTAEDETPITVIDTPGLNDSCGAEIRDHVQSLKIFIANASSKGFEIHAIGFVAQTHLVRLTSSERLVMDYVSTIFGERVSDHLITFVTFADNQNTPPIIEAMQNYGVNFKQFFKFNNSALSNRNSDEVHDLDRVYWKISRKQWKNCLKIIKFLPCLSVKTMKAVQSEVYAATVIESTKKSLTAEMYTFLKQCYKENCISMEMEKVCKQIWQLAAVLQKLKSEKESSFGNVEHVLTNCAVEVCKTLLISPEKMVNYLSLTPSGILVATGSEIIRTLEPVYKFSKSLHGNSESFTKYEWLYCHHCESDHKLVRITNKKSVKKHLGLGLSVFLWDPPESILYYKCQRCQCSADLHGASKIKFPFTYQKILEHTYKRLHEVLESYSLPGYPPVSKESYLKCLGQRLGPNYFEFLHEISNVECKR